MKEALKIQSRVKYQHLNISFSQFRHIKNWTKDGHDKNQGSQYSNNNSRIIRRRIYIYQWLSQTKIKDVVIVLKIMRMSKNVIS